VRQADYNTIVVSWNTPYANDIKFAGWGRSSLAKKFSSNMFGNKIRNQYPKMPFPHRAAMAVDGWLARNSIYPESKATFSFT